MNEQIGVTNWFTKVRADIVYGPACDLQVERLVTEIGSSFGKRSLVEASDRISSVLRQNEFLQSVCSDTRLPVCSLYHHLRNTAAVAVCLTIDAVMRDRSFISTCLTEYGLKEGQIQAYSDEDFFALVRIGSLLHDLGKVRTYSAERKNLQFHNHIPLTEQIVEEILKGVDPLFVSRYGLDLILPKIAARHHGKDATTRIEKIIHTGDVISSSADRRYEVSGTVEDGVLSVRSADPVFPHEINCNDGDYACNETPHTVLLGYRQTAERKVTDKNPDNKYRVLFRDSVVSGGPGSYAGNWPIKGEIGYFALDVMQIQEFIGEAEKLPLLRGGSGIVTDILKRIKDIITEKVCSEAILFADGGNLLSFVPVNQDLQHLLREEAERIVRDMSGGTLQVAVSVGSVPLSRLSGSFHKFLEDIFNSLNEMKQRPVEVPVIRPPRKDMICEACRNRLVFGNLELDGQRRQYCQPCLKKYEFGKDVKEELSRDTDGWGAAVPVRIIKENHIRFPRELTDIGSSIAVIAVDGNMMGRLFSHTLTPAEYTFKSEQFTNRFYGIVRDCLETLITEDLSGKGGYNLLTIPVSPDTGRKAEYTTTGFDIVYVGGDDLLIIMNAKAALSFCRMLIERVADTFTFSRRLYDGSTTEEKTYRTVTVSCGVALADSKFPIYFLLDRARKMEAKAKEKFRKGTNPDEMNLLKPPAGAVAFTSVQGAMPSGEDACYVLPDDNAEFDMLMDIVKGSLGDKKAVIRDLVTCGESEMERLDFIKFNYASAMRKQQEVLERIGLATMMATVVNNPDTHKAVKMVVPLLWHDGGDA